VNIANRKLKSPENGNFHKAHQVLGGEGSGEVSEILKAYPAGAQLARRLP
jgi:hypothetical protein